MLPWLVDHVLEQRKQRLLAAIGDGVENRRVLQQRLAEVERRHARRQDPVWGWLWRWLYSRHDARVAAAFRAQQEATHAQPGDLDPEAAGPEPACPGAQRGRRLDGAAHAANRGAHRL